MNTLYDSESFAVMHLLAGPVDGSAEDSTRPTLERHGFEIVDKRSNKEVFLDGAWAELFQQQILAWQQNTPSQDEVEETLDRYAALAHTPVLLH
ncbi:MAG: DUF3567 domain-containing protein [Burkholderiaceae bacterium]